MEKRLTYFDLFIGFKNELIEHENDQGIYRDILSLDLSATDFIIFYIILPIITSFMANNISEAFEVPSDNSSEDSLKAAIEKLKLYELKLNEESKKDLIEKVIQNLFPYGMTEDQAEDLVDEIIATIKKH